MSVLPPSAHAGVSVRGNNRSVRTLSLAHEAETDALRFLREGIQPLSARESVPATHSRY